MAVGCPDAPEIVLTVEDVARTPDGRLRVRQIAPGSEAT
jgi:hypothetical protein